MIYQVTLYDEIHASGIEFETELYREYSLQVIVSNVNKESEGERLGREEMRNSFRQCFEKKCIN